MVRRTAPPARVGPSPWDLPDPASAPPDGLVALGADLEAETLVDAYRRGIFPWPHADVPLPWFSPDPRGLLDLRSGGAVATRSLRQHLRRCGWTTTVDAEFDAVLAACAVRPGGEPTWIDEEMREAYRRLHRLGWAHSLEVWSELGGPDEPGRPELVGGLYGVTVGGCFTGESMFHRRPNGSKAAFVDLAERWREAGGTLVDVQLPTEHLTRLGAVARRRAEFLALLEEVGADDVRMQTRRLPVSRLVGPGSGE